MRNDKTTRWVAWTLIVALVIGVVTTALSLFFQ